MTPIEHYWPSEMLAATFPDRFGHLAPKTATPPADHAAVAHPYTVERGCRVYRPDFSKGRSRRPIRAKGRHS
ncbi:UNVERIFIED_ORG: hypothetical protein J2W74_005239 [Methylorubrum zatmanii]